jgi:hypothetical protein
MTVLKPTLMKLTLARQPFVNKKEFHENPTTISYIDIRSQADIQKDRETDEGRNGLAIHTRLTLREEDPK